MPHRKETCPATSAGECADSEKAARPTSALQSRAAAEILARCHPATPSSFQTARSSPSSVLRRTRSVTRSSWSSCSLRGVPHLPRTSIPVTMRPSSSWRGHWSCSEAGRGSGPRPAAWSPCRAGRGTRFATGSRAPLASATLHDPAQGFESYITRLHALVSAAGSVRPTSPRVAFGLAQLWLEHADTIRPADAPLRVAIGGLGRAGRRLRVAPVMR